MTHAVACQETVLWTLMDLVFVLKGCYIAVQLPVKTWYTDYTASSLTIVEHSTVFNYVSIDFGWCPNNHSVTPAHTVGKRFKVQRVVS